jgi:hypothetical protein
MKKIIGIVLVLLSIAVFSAFAAPKVDAGIVGVWGVDSKGGYEFKADGTFIMEGSVKYLFTATDGVWKYWMEVSPKSAVTADYKLSADGKNLQINLKKGHPFQKLIRVK